MDKFQVNGSVPGMAKPNLIHGVLAYIARQQPGAPELEVIRLAALTALPLGALVNLRRADVDYENLKITCKHKGRTTQVSMTAEVSGLLRAFDPNESGFYFTRGERPVDVGEVREHWEALCILAGLRNDEGRMPAFRELRAAALRRLATACGG